MASQKTSCASRTALRQRLAYHRDLQEKTDSKRHFGCFSLQEFSFQTKPPMNLPRQARDQKEVNFTTTKRFPHAPSPAENASSVNFPRACPKPVLVK
jgi:hypothetical protein